MTRDHFDTIRSHFGHFASWAVWATTSGTPKSNIANLEVLDPDLNPHLLAMLRPNIFMVGLNCSRPLGQGSLRNFHDANPRGQDFKIRYAFENTPFYGAYMTDVIKEVEALSVKELEKILRTTPGLLDENLQALREELRLVSAKPPIILAFGSLAYKLLAKGLRKPEYSHLIQLTHYSDYISKENYRERVLEQLSGISFVS